MSQFMDVRRRRRATLALLLATSLLSCQAVPAPRHAFTGEPLLPGTALSAAVNEYFHLRKVAIVARDIELLWSRYPDLRTGEDLPAGVNVEGWVAMRSDSARSLADVIYDLDRYERLRARVSGDEAVVRVHGLERYIGSDFSDQMAGEFILDLHLRRDRDSGRWSVVRTDEMTLGELHSAGPGG